MTRDKNEQVPHPTDPPIDGAAAIDGAASRDADVEGHSLVTLELARIITSERVRDGEKMNRDAARVREARPNRDGGFLKRFGRR